MCRLPSFITGLQSHLVSHGVGLLQGFLETLKFSVIVWLLSMRQSKAPLGKALLLGFRIMVCRFSSGLAYHRMTHLIPLSLLPLFGIFCCLPVGETF